MNEQCRENMNVEVSHETAVSLRKLAASRGCSIEDVLDNLVREDTPSLTTAVLNEFQEFAEAFDLDPEGAVEMLLMITRAQRREHLIATGRSEFTNHIPADQFTLGDLTDQSQGFLVFDFDVFLAMQRRKSQQDGKA